VRVFVVYHGRKPVADAHHDVRVLLSLSNSQSSSPSAYEYASLKRGRAYTSAGRRFTVSKKSFEFRHARNVYWK
jgi:hypothetical protein